jgi:hypothetical protein
MKVGPAVAVAGWMMVVDVVTAPEVLVAIGALVFIEHPAAAAMPTTVVMSSRSPSLTAGEDEVPSRFIELTPNVTSTRRP